MIVVVAALAAIWILTGESPMDIAQQIAAAIDDLATRGQKLTSSTPSTEEIRAGSYVNESPSDLAGVAAALLQRPVATASYVLARIIRSERARGGTNLEAVCIAWVCLNQSKGWGDHQALISWACPNGKFGRQAGRKVATTLDPYEGDLTVAEAVLAGLIQDPTDGATNYLHPKGFATKAAYQAVYDRWYAAGLRPMTISGAPGIEVWK